MPHEDGAAYYPLVATVSLGAPIVLDLYPKGGDSERAQFRILQERRSLLVTRKRIYTDFLHGIKETEREEEIGPGTVCNWELLREREGFEGGSFDRGTRVSLTYRDVLKVAKMGNTMMKFLGAR